MVRTKIAGFRRKSYKTLQAMARQTTTYHQKINDMGIIQVELLSKRVTSGLAAPRARGKKPGRQPDQRPVADKLADKVNAHEIRTFPRQPPFPSNYLAQVDLQRILNSNRGKS